MLAREFRSHGYDLKFLIRAITATKAYALTSGVGRIGDGAGEPVRRDAGPHPFAGPALRDARPGDRLPREAVSTATSTRGIPARRFVELFTNRDEKPTEGETSILQALALMNGPLMANVTSLESSDTLAAVAEAPYLDTPGRIETLYLAALTRRPRPGELERLVALRRARRHPPANRSKALADVFWALLNSPEFRFNH